jgi:hypothetical protein
MRFGSASLACLATALVLIAIRGPYDWSASFVLLWYGLLGAASILAAPATAIAFLNRRLPVRLRVTIAAMALPSLLGVPIAVWMIENAAGTLPY